MCIGPLYSSTVRLTLETCALHTRVHVESDLAPACMVHETILHDGTNARSHEKPQECHVQGLY
jgi:hypothetical protein